VAFEVPADASIDGHRVDGVIGYLTWTTGIVFLVACAVLAITLIRDRARAGRVHGAYTHGDRPRDRALTFTIGLVMFLGIDAVLAVRAMGDLSGRFWNYPDADPRALRVEVTAQQWAWTFRTAGPDGRFATADDVVTLGELHVPIGRPIYLQLRSHDVIHAFYVPNLRTKMDAIPGSTTRLWFEVRSPGRYEIACSQHCGVSHNRMRALMFADAEPDYRAWLARAEIDSRLRYDPADPATAQAWAWENRR
jgi:cytochrome c oxidase subunit II